MSRYKHTFEQLAKKDELAFVPFTVIGYPDKITSIDIIDQFIESGADMLELGFPFSDPIADGPIIQQATHKAIQNGMNTSGCFDVVSTIRKKHPSIPIGILVYAQVVYSYDISEFFKQCQQSGIDSVLIADLPFKQKDEFLTYAVKYDVDLVYLLAPNMNVAESIVLQKSSNAYVYVLSRSGITGLDEFRLDQSERREVIQKHKNVAHLLGFGISKPEQVINAANNGFNGVIVGSKIISIIEKYGINNELRDFLIDMKNATTDHRFIC